MWLDWLNQAVCEWRREWDSNPRSQRYIRTGDTTRMQASGWPIRLAWLNGFQVLVSSCYPVRLVLSGVIQFGLQRVCRYEEGAVIGTSPLHCLPSSYSTFKPSGLPRIRC